MTACSLQLAAGNRKIVKQCDSPQGDDRLPSVTALEERIDDQVRVLSQRGRVLFM